jgi:hypothetical protein
MRVVSLKDAGLRRNLNSSALGIIEGTFLSGPYDIFLLDFVRDSKPNNTKTPNSLRQIGFRE